MYFVLQGSEVSAAERIIRGSSDGHKLALKILSIVCIVYVHHDLIYRRVNETSKIDSHTENDYLPWFYPVERGANSRCFKRVVSVSNILGLSASPETNNNTGTHNVHSYSPGTAASRSPGVDTIQVS
jgi:hypothetical protein